MPIPTPEEGPDLYDDYDGRPDVTPEQKAREKSYWGHIAERALEPKSEDPPRTPDNTKNPTPEERPDLYDYQDCRPGNSYPEANRDAVTPDHIKQAIAERQAKQAETGAG